MQFVDLGKQYSLIKHEVQRRVSAVLEHGKFILGPEVKELEERLCALSGAQYCTGISNGSDALLVALMALGVKAGDEVIAPAFSFIATASMARLLGATPVFVDINKKTFNLEPALLEQAITPRTKVIIAVDLYGQPADYAKINAIADRHGIPVIADAAQSFGATYHGKAVGTLATITSVSFYPSKPLGAYGEGGALFTDDPNLAKKIRMIHNHGAEVTYDHQCLGLNARLETIQAAMLLAKLPLLGTELAQRKQVAANYNARLQGSFPTPFIMPHTESAFAQYTILVEDRHELRAHLSEEGIPTAVHYPKPMHLQTVFHDLGYKMGSFPVSEYLAEHVLSLPMHPYLTQEDVDKVAAQLALSYS